MSNKIEISRGTQLCGRKRKIHEMNNLPQTPKPKFHRDKRKEREGEGERERGRGREKERGGRVGYINSHA